jgi:hypothetical protein
MTRRSAILCAILLAVMGVLLIGLGIVARQRDNVVGGLTIGIGVLSLFFANYARTYAGRLDQ